MPVSLEPALFEIREKPLCFQEFGTPANDACVVRREPKLGSRRLTLSLTQEGLCQGDPRCNTGWVEGDRALEQSPGPTGTAAEEAGQIKEQPSFCRQRVGVVGVEFEGSREVFVYVRKTPEVRDRRGSLGEQPAASGCEQHEVGLGRLRIVFERLFGELLGEAIVGHAHRR